MVGPVGSGKSTLARRLSALLQIPCFELDNIVHRGKGKNRRKRKAQERDFLFSQILSRSVWIVEDIGRKVFHEGLRQADLVVFLDFPSFVRIYRIHKRWLMQLLGCIPCNYRPTLFALSKLLLWSKHYEKRRRRFVSSLSSLGDKLLVLHSPKEAALFLENVSLYIKARQTKERTQ